MYNDFGVLIPFRSGLLFYRRNNAQYSNVARVLIPFRSGLHFYAQPGAGQIDLRVLIPFRSGLLFYYR